MSLFKLTIVGYDRSEVLKPCYSVTTTDISFGKEDFFVRKYFYKSEKLSHD